MTDTVQIAGSRVLVGFTRFLLWLFFTFAIAIGVATAVGNTVEIATSLSSGHLPLTLVADKALPTAATQCVGCHLTGTFANADVTVSGLSGQVITFVLIAAISNALTELALCVLVAVLTWRLLRRGFFRKAVANTVSAGGGVLIIGGMLSQSGVAIAGGMAASQINGDGHGYWPLAGTFDPTIMVFGFVLLLVGLAFEYGARLQKDAEGLV